MRVLSPKDASVVRLKLEDSSDPTKYVELDATTANDGEVSWESLSWDFSTAENLNHATTYDKANVFFDFLQEPTGEAYYFDDVTFNGYIS